ncbi:ABC transporter substrate-binding protein [uncultured Hydrogenophaga sp.]|uniref:ABC transporter substrate-binding protein n=1 Tax=uncultured Hydrogenophaga sp. TaxID=199683 RepID=UPI00265E9774|nr:ABC transporter substrate-binding protein [uncultured Hydrogenophaga sp.]
MKRKLIAAAIATVLAGGAPFAMAQQGKLSGDAVKIGVLTDMSGLYADYGGPGAVAAARLAVQDFGGKMFGKDIVVVNADHQNKPDVAKNVAQQWFDRDGVDISVENLNSAVALTVQALAKEKNKITITTGAATARLTNEDCAPANGIHYLMDTIALSNVVGKAIVKDGGDSWFFLTADYAFGHSLEKDTSEVVRTSGGKVSGAVRHPLGTSDFSSFLLQAQTSGAKVVGLANAGGDTVNSIKAAAEFGITRKQNLAALLMLLTDVHAIGLNTAQGLYLTEGWYWDLNAETRAWADKFGKVMNNRKPNSNHASVYSATMHYLKAVQAAGTDDTAAVMAKMKEMPINDMFAKGGKIREDGRMVHDMYLFQVKKPSESKGAWDYYNLKGTIKGDDAFQPLAQSRCAAIKK